jgi:hypothetical protein
MVPFQVPESLSRFRRISSGKANMGKLTGAFDVVLENEMWRRKCGHLF